MMNGVKQVKLVIVLCGVVGLLGLALPIGGPSLLAGMFEVDKLEAAVDAAIFVLPLAAGVLGLARPPMMPWQAGVALAAFVLGVVRFRVWELAAHLGASGLHGGLLLVAVVAGTIATIAALLRPEAPL